MTESASAIRFEEQHWPVLVVRFVGAPSDEEFTAYLDHLEVYQKRTGPYAIVYVTDRNAPMTKPRHAKQQASWIKQHAPRIRIVTVGIAFVLPSPLMRGVLRAILAMQPMPVDYAVFRYEDEAMQWARSKLRTAAHA